MHQRSRGFNRYRYQGDRPEFWQDEFNFGGNNNQISRFDSNHNRRHRGRRRRKNRRNEADDQNSAAERLDRPKPPPHLRGKAIGLFYRDRAKLRNKEKIIPKLIFSSQRVERIEKLLQNLDEQKSTSSEEIRPLRTHFQREYMDITTVSFTEKLDQCLEMSQVGINKFATQEKNEELQADFINKMKERRYLEMLEFRKELPAYQYRAEILRAIKNNQVVVISGDTGCGKSTQVGQLILEEACVSNKGAEVRIIITQPRRIAATSVAARIADERGEILGDSVGYAIRLENVPSRGYGSIEVVTAGVVLQRLQRDPALINVTHLIIDEAHERDTTCDILLGIAKLIITKRKSLKVILMSATMDSERFCGYFNGCPKVDIPGRMYDVEVYHLEDVIEMTRFTDFPPPKLIGAVRSRRKRELLIMEKNMEHRKKMEQYVTNLQRSGRYSPMTLNMLMDCGSEELCIELAAELVVKLCQTQPPGAILVFLPGLADISLMCRLLNCSGQMPPHVIYPLHSQLNSLDQNAIFKEPPRGVRKIIVATNIAETSITINDVVYVVDSGKMKIGNYDVDNDVKTLKPEWVSHANALQRQGRAGRVRPGICYRLYSGQVFSELSPRVAPELIRAPVHEPLLASLLLRLHPAPQFLASLLDPPQDTAVKTAVNLLTRMNILNETEHLTPLGVHVARLPVSPGAARMLIYASLLSAVTPITRVAAVVAFKDPFTFSVGCEKEMEECRWRFSKGTNSDQLAAAEAQRQWEAIYKKGNRRITAEFCNENFLSDRTLRMLLDMRKQFGQLLFDSHFTTSVDADSPDSNLHSHNTSLLKALIVAGLYPNVAFFKNPKRKSRFTLITHEDGRVEIHPGSVNAISLTDASHMVYRLKQLSTSLYIHDTSPAHALPLLFFGDQFRISDDENDKERCIVWCGEMSWGTTHRKARLVERLRVELHALLQDKLQDPKPVSWDSNEGVILRAIIEMITAEDEEINSDGENEHIKLKAPIHLPHYQPVAGCSSNNKGPTATINVSDEILESDDEVEPVNMETNDYIPLNLMQY